MGYKPVDPQMVQINGVVNLIIGLLIVIIAVLTLSNKVFTNIDIKVPELKKPEQKI